MLAGNIVILVTGGPRMIVTVPPTTIAVQEAECAWFDEAGVLHREVLPLAGLKFADKERP